MAKLTRDDILKLARLSRLKLDDDEIKQFEREISAILGYVEQIQNADVAGVSPTFQVTGLESVMRPDTVRDYGPSPEKLMANAPAKEAGQFKVRRMVE